MKLIQIVIAASLMLSACAELSEREKLLNHYRKIYQDASRELAKADGSQIELTSAAGSFLIRAESLLKLAVDFRLRNYPEETQQIQEELQTLNRMSDAILNASREGTGTIESMVRYSRIADLTYRQVEIFLSSEEDYARWQRIKAASGEIQGCSFTMENGMACLNVSPFGEEVTLEAQLRPEHCFSCRGADYAIVSLDMPSGLTSEFRFMYLMRIQNQKMEVIQELPFLNVESWRLKDDTLLLKGNERYNEKSKKMSITLKHILIMTEQ